MRFLMALFNLYVSLWKACSVPEPKPVSGKAPVLYNHENDDHDWEWPEVPLNADIHDLDERFQRIIDRMRGLPGIDAESVRMAYLGFDLTFANRGDVEDEYQAWLQNTNEGRFTQYLIDNGRIGDGAA